MYAAPSIARVRLLTEYPQDLTCNVNGAKAAAGTCAVNAGDLLAAEMHQQPGDRSCSNEAIGGDHFGPTLIYMAKVDNAATTTPWTAGWFKVNNTGLITAYVAPHRTCGNAGG
jgi:cellulase